MTSPRSISPHAHSVIDRNLHSSRSTRQTASSAPGSPRMSHIQFHASSSPGPRQNFLEPLQSSRRSASSMTTAQDIHEREEEFVSSGDEMTAIVGREVGGARSYRTGVQSTGNDGGDGGQRPRSARERVKSRGNDGMVLSDDEPEHALSPWKQFLEKYGSIELENKGSVARDHLALERTFLAWLRTSLSFASIGIAITQLFRLNTTINRDSPTPPQLRLRHVGKPLGATFLAIGIVVLFIGFHRYFESQHYVVRGKFPASRGSIVIVTFISMSLIIASFVVILVFGAAAQTG